MSIKLPRAVVIVLLTTGTLLLWLSTYLENEHLALLARHPVYVNLLSGTIGFCFGIVALSVVLSTFITRAQEVEQRRALDRGLKILFDRLLEFSAKSETNSNLIDPNGMLAPGTMSSETLILAKAITQCQRAPTRKLDPSFHRATVKWLNLCVRISSTPNLESVDHQVQKCQQTLSLRDFGPMASVELVDGLNELTSELVRALGPSKRVRVVARTSKPRPSRAGGRKRRQ